MIDRWLDLVDGLIFVICCVVGPVVLVALMVLLVKMVWLALFAGG